MLALALLATAAAGSVLFDPSVQPDRMAVLCDSRRFRFSIRAEADAASVDRSYPRRLVIDPESLMEPLSNSHGETQFRGPLVRYIRCGPYAIRLQGDAYNLNVEGEAGAYDAFAAVKVSVDQFVVYPTEGDGSIRLTSCSRDLTRAAPCPDGYAVRVDGRYDAARHKLVLTETTLSSLEASPEDTPQVRTRHQEVVADFAMWHPDAGNE